MRFFVFFFSFQIVSSSTLILVLLSVFFTPLCFSVQPFGQFSLQPQLPRNSNRNLLFQPQQVKNRKWQQGSPLLPLATISPSPPCRSISDGLSKSCIVWITAWIYPNLRHLLRNQPIPSLAHHLVQPLRFHFQLPLLHLLPSVLALPVDPASFRFRCPRLAHPLLLLVWGALLLHLGQLDSEHSASVGCNPFPLSGGVIGDLFCVCVYYSRRFLCVRFFLPSLSLLLSLSLFAFCYVSSFDTVL